MNNMFSLTINHIIRYLAPHIFIKYSINSKVCFWIVLLLKVSCPHYFHNYSIIDSYGNFIIKVIYITSAIFAFTSKAMYFNQRLPPITPNFNRVMGEVNICIVVILYRLCTACEANNGHFKLKYLIFFLKNKKPSRNIF